MAVFDCFSESGISVLLLFGRRLRDRLRVDADCAELFILLSSLENSLQPNAISRVSEELAQHFRLQQQPCAN